MGRPEILMKTPTFSQNRSVTAPFPGTMSMTPSAGAKTTDVVRRALKGFHRNHIVLLPSPLL